MSLHTLANQIKVGLALTAVTAGTSAQNGTIVIDTQGYDGCLFLFNFGDVDDTSVLTCFVEQNTANSTSGMAAITGATATKTASATSCDLKNIQVDVYRPQQRYLRACLTRATANAVVQNVVYVLYRGRSEVTGLAGDCVAKTTVAPS